MPTLLIDGQPIEVAPGTTLLAAAATLGIEVPTLCHLRGEEPLAACMVCLVEDAASGRLLAACASRAADGMRIETASARARAGRRTALELLLSDHAGDCEAPCSRACPLHLDLPALLDSVQAGELRAAWAALRGAVALPATAARLCRGGCEKACRRRQLDEPVQVPRLHARVAEWGLANARAAPALRARSGRRVAIVGAGAAGLAAVDLLSSRGHDCTLLDARRAAGESLRNALGDDGVGHEQLAREIEAILRGGVRFRPGVRVGVELSVAEILRSCDLVVLAIEQGAAGLERLPSGAVLDLEADLRPAANPSARALRALARGRDLGLRAHRVLEGEDAGSDRGDRFAAATTGGSQLVSPSRDELCALHADRMERLKAARGGADANGETPSAEDVLLVAEAARCLGCGCLSASTCALRRLARAHEAEPRRFVGARRAVERTQEHALVRFEPGKCILCGRCVRLAEEAGEPLGLGLVGRGFATRVRVPLERALADSLVRCALACAAACPTGAIRIREAAVGETEAASARAGSAG